MVALSAIDAVDADDDCAVHNYAVHNYAVHDYAAGMQKTRSGGQQTWRLANAVEAVVDGLAGVSTAAAAEEALPAEGWYLLAEDALGYCTRHI